MHRRAGQIVVIFVSVRTGDDDAGYAAAARAMEDLAVEQPGYRGFESARGSDGLGVTLSYWADEASAIAWRDHADHAAIRNAGRGRWYRRYDVIVSEVRRSYSWSRA